MIVACPECSHPFEIADDQIASLVQIECPHCAFRMILDFAAANDPSLVEEGMRMASGWRSAADYRAQMAAPAAEAERARPKLAAVPEPEPEPAPELERVATAVGRAAATSPAAASRPSITPAFETRPPSFDAQETRLHDTTAPEAPKTIVDVPAEAEAPPIAVAPSPASRPRIEIELDDSMEEDEGPTQIHTPSLAASVMAPRTSDVVVRKQVTTPAEEPPRRTSMPEAARPAAEARVPPHTPPGRPVITDEPSTPAPTRETSTRSRPAPRFESITLPQDEAEDAPKSSALGTAFVLILLLGALGLVGASVALEGTPDPRPLLEKLYRQNLQK